MLIAIISAKGAPGVTSTALALALHWPKPSIVLEADTSGSSIIPGYHRGQYAHDRGIVPLAMAHNVGALTTQEISDQAIPLNADGSARFIPGVVTAAKAAAARDLWGSLASELAAYDQVDTIVDVGRVTPGRDDRDPILAMADIVLIATTSRLADMYITRQLVDHRLAGTPDVGRELTSMRALTIGPGRPYEADYVARSIGLRSVGDVAWDPKIAACYSDGAQLPIKYVKTAYAKSITRLVTTISDQVTERREQLQGVTR